MLVLWHGLIYVFTEGLRIAGGLTGSYGVGIILLTLAIRVVLFPLYRAQLMSMVRLQRIQPELDAVKQKYKGNQEKIASEQMRLMKESGSNPLLGCLPTLLQLPIMWAFYDMLHNFKFPGGFLWLPSLGKPDPLYILPVLGGLSTYWQTRASMSLQPSSTRQQMQMMMYMAPILTFVIFYRLASGVAVYWVVSNILTVAQQYMTVGLRRGPRGVDGHAESKS